MGVLFFCLASGASYPEPSTTNTAVIVGSDNPTPATTVATGINTNAIYYPETTTTQFKTDKELFSRKEICEISGGCWNIGCFPYGYVTNETYCSTGYNNKLKRNEKMFIQQKNAMEQCNNSFECKSNFCFNRECIDVINTVDDGVVRIDKSDLEELREIIENAEISIEKGYDEEVLGNFFDSLIGLFRKLFGL